MNKITAKQNEPDQLKLQYAASIFYNRAEISNYIVWVLCLLSAAMVFLSGYTSAVPFAIIFFSDIFAFVLKKYMERAVFVAADFRKLFDRNVFELENDCVNTRNNFDRLAELREKVIARNFRDFTVQSENTGRNEPPGVKNWYDTNADMSGAAATFECQKENVWWDKKISVYQWLFFGVITILLISVVALLLRAKSLAEVLLILLSEAGLLIRLCERITVIYKYKKVSIEIDTIVSSFDAFAEHKGVSTLQSKIEQRREIPMTHMNYLHKKAARKLTELYTKVKR